MKLTKLLILLLPLSVSLIGCNSQEKPKEDPPIIIDDDDDNGGGTHQDDEGGGGSSTYVKDEFSKPIKFDETLPIGNRVIGGPNNLSTPDDIASGKVYDLSSSLPANFSYIQGNNKVNACSDFYSESAGGGFKFSHLWYGFQSSAFTGYKYVDFTIHITSVNNKSGTPDVDKDVLHIYGYNSKEECILQKNIAQGVITKQTENSDITITIQNDAMNYFEFRLNANPYKGTQCYNFGMGSITVKGRN